MVIYIFLSSSDTGFNFILFKIGEFVATDSFNQSLSPDCRLDFSFVQQSLTRKRPSTSPKNRATAKSGGPRHILLHLLISKAQLSTELFDAQILLPAGMQVIFNCTKIITRRCDLGSIVARQIPQLRSRNDLLRAGGEQTEFVDSYGQRKNIGCEAGSVFLEVKIQSSSRSHQ